MRRIFLFSFVLSLIASVALAISEELPPMPPSSFPLPEMGAILFREDDEFMRLDSEVVKGGRIVITQETMNSFEIIVSFSRPFNSAPSFLIFNGIDGKALVAETWWDRGASCFSAKASSWPVPKYSDGILSVLPGVKGIFPMLVFTLPPFEQEVQMRVEARIDGKSVDPKTFPIFPAFRMKFDEKTMAAPLDRCDRVIGVSRGIYPTAKVFIKGGKPPYKVLYVQTNGYKVVNGWVSFFAPNQDRSSIFKNLSVNIGENGDPLIEMEFSDLWLAEGKYEGICIAFGVEDSRHIIPTFEGFEQGMPKRQGIKLVPAASPQGIGVPDTPIPTPQPLPTQKSKKISSFKIECLNWDGLSEKTIAVGASLELTAKGGQTPYKWEYSDAFSWNVGVYHWQERPGYAWGRNYPYFHLSFSEDGWKTLPLPVFINIMVTDKGGKGDSITVKIQLLEKGTGKDGEEVNVVKLAPGQVVPLNPSGKLLAIWGDIKEQP